MAHGSYHVDLELSPPTYEEAISNPVPQLNKTEPEVKPPHQSDAVNQQERLPILANQDPSDDFPEVC